MVTRRQTFAITAVAGILLVLSACTPDPGPATDGNVEVLLGNGALHMAQGGPAPAPVCWTVDFDTDARGAAIVAPAEVSLAWADWGITVSAARVGEDDPVVPVAVDACDPLLGNVGVVAELDDEDDDHGGEDDHDDDHTAFEDLRAPTCPIVDDDHHDDDDQGDDDDDDSDDDEVVSDQISFAFDAERCVTSISLVGAQADAAIHLFAGGQEIELVPVPLGSDPLISLDRCGLDAITVDLAGGAVDDLIVCDSGGPDIDMDAVEQVWFTIDALALEGPSGWSLLSKDSWTLDLLAPPPAPATVLARGDLPPGDYMGVRFELSAVTLKVGPDMVDLPPAAFGTDPIQVDVPFTVRDCGTSQVTLGWDLTLLLAPKLDDLDMVLQVSGNSAIDASACP